MRKKGCAGVKQRFLSNKSYHDQLKMGTCIIIGVENALGKKLALELSTLSNSFLLVSEDTSKADALAQNIEKAALSNGKKVRVQSLYCEFGSLRIVSNLAQLILDKLTEEGFPHLSLIVFCNNEKPSKKKRVITWEGFEKQFQINILAPAFIFLKLRDCLVSSQQQCKFIFLTTKKAQEGPFSVFDLSDSSDIMRKIAKPQYVEEYLPQTCYNTSKMLIMHLAQGIHQFESKNGITACSVVVKDNWKGMVAPILHACLLPFERVNGLCCQKFEMKALPEVAQDSGTLFRFVKLLCRNYAKFEVDIAERAKRRHERPAETHFNPFITHGFPDNLLDFPVTTGVDFLPIRINDEDSLSS